MSELTSYPLSHLSTLTILGKDTIKFLQGQGTQDFSNLEPNKWVSGAFCSAKGRAITNVLICPHATQPDAIMLLCHKSSAEPLLKHLLKYAAFFRGTQLLNTSQRFQLLGLKGVQATAQLSQWSESFKDTLIYGQLPDGRFIFAIDSLAPAYDLFLSELKSTGAVENSQWQYEDIINNLLWLDEEQFEQWIPQHFSLDLMDGISFKKGCYTGQEVIARLHFKGQSKKRLYRIKWPDFASTDSRKLYQDGKVVGDIIQQVNYEQFNWALAILKTDNINQQIYLDENLQLPVELLD